MWAFWQTLWMSSSRSTQAPVKTCCSSRLLFRRARVYTPCSWASPWHLHLLLVASTGQMSYSHLPHFESRNLLFYVWVMISICLPVQETPETWIWSQGQEDPLEKGMATHSSNLAGEFHGQRNWASYSPWDSKELDMTGRVTSFFYSSACHATL